MPTMTTPLRGLARQTATVLRLGAGLLDHVAGGGGEQAAAETPQPETARARATARRTPGAAKETPKARAVTKRPGRSRSAAPKDLDDVTIARKVETEIFRDPTVPKGHIDVNVAGGVVYLRGEVKHPDDVKRLAAQAEAIPEVK